MTYLSEIQQAMKILSEQPNALFIGQAVRYPGQAMHRTLDLVPMEKRIEMPVIEEFQMGHSIGLALQGYLPISIFPRFDFLILAMNQLVNHLDKLPLMSGFQPKVIIRTSVGATEPLNPGLQHCQNHTEAFKRMLKIVEVIELLFVDQVIPAYAYALESKNSVLMVEHGSMY